MVPEVNNARNAGTPINTWKLNNMLQNGHWIKDIKMEIKTVLKQMKIESQYTKINGCSKRRSKRKVYTDKYINVNV